MSKRPVSTQNETEASAAKKSKLAASAPKDPMAIIDELYAIEKLPWDQRDAAKRLRPEWFEFSTSWSRSSRTIRKRANEILATCPGLTKKKLCEATGIATVGQLTKFLENKGGCRDRTGVSCSAESRLCDLINIIEHTSESSTKRTHRLQGQLKHGMGHGNRGEEGRWSPDKLVRFQKAFPGIELSYGEKWWQVQEKKVKDPNKPKRNASAYFLYTQAQKVELEQQPWH